MKSCVLLWAILQIPALSQMLVGTVQKIDKDQVQIKARDGVFTFRADDKTTVAKVKKANDLSILAVGDQVRVNYYGEGTFMAVNISAQVTVSGTIAQAATNHLLVSRDSTGDSVSKGSVFVFVDPGTKLGVTRDQLKAGRKVRVTGWDAGGGVVEAERIAVN